MSEAVKTIPKYKDIIAKHKAKEIFTRRMIKDHASSLDNQNVLGYYLFGSHSRYRSNLYGDINILFIFDELKDEGRRDELMETSFWLKPMDPSKLNALGWKHTMELEDGIRMMNEWYLESNK